MAYQADGKEIHDFPSTPTLARCKPVLKTLPGWKCDIRGIRKFEDLPKACRDYILFAEEQMGVPIKIISNGPAREDVIYR